jgi:hypothetical protein
MILDETEDQLDISILPAEKYLKGRSDIERLLNTNLSIEHKTDGTKLTVVHVANNGNIDDWILAYKNDVIYANEFKYQNSDEIRKNSIGFSQYKIVVDHFASLGKCNIPVNYEYAVEFLQRKPTLSSNYTNPHHMVLIGYCPCQYKVEFGKLRTNSKVMNTEFRDQYADSLGIDTPNKLFNGVMADKNSFEAGIINNNLKKEYDSLKDKINWDDPEVVWSLICEILLNVESKYGGREEGVVLKFGGTILKVQQKYQVDQKARRAIKAKFQMSPDEEKAYWKSVQDEARKLADQCNTGTFEMRLENLSKLVSKTDFGVTHLVKNTLQIKDDIHLTAKMLIQKELEGNNGCLVLGKFRVLTTGHENVIRTALKNFDRVLVCLVSSKDTNSTKSLRREMLERTFGNKIEIIETTSGFIARMIQKSPFNINAVYCGSDRLEDYKRQCETLLGVSVIEYERDDSAISATKVIANIEDKKFFMASTPKAIHSMYKTLLDTYK